MTTDVSLRTALASSSGLEEDLFKRKDIAHVFIHHNKVVGLQGIPGLSIEHKERDDGVSLKVVLERNIKVAQPVHMCFGLMHKQGLQRIQMDVQIKENASMQVFAHCTFPNAIDVQHLMDATLTIGRNASYSYVERHIHGDSGGITVVPKARIHLLEHARYKTDFELLKGRVGHLDIDYEAVCDAYSILEMNARINATHTDVVRIKEKGALNGDYAHGVLLTRVAVRNQATAEVYSELTASAAYARGHVDCKEIVQDDGVVSAVPIVKVNHPKAHITHEASLGSVDSKQLQTLMARGLDEERATNLIIQGLLR
jgi:Fe-S cluster assembly scaffold protein SufB